MHRRGYLVTVLGFTAVVLACAASLAAATGSDALIKARQASMKEMAAAAKTIAGMFDDKLAYEPQAFKAAAQTLRARTGAALSEEFPDATLGPPSGARLEIGQARPEFEALARHIGTLADVLAAKAGRAPANITHDMRMGSGLAMGGGSLLGKRPAAEPNPATLPVEHLLHLILQDCTSCHSKFRQKLK